ncbi:hypothetical protein XNC3_1640123 [Xenorhabdus nematophila F1]|nr:hypothetical protein XNC3_1640123 [Xenorhabdus nematophila F1]
MQTTQTALLKTLFTVQILLNQQTAKSLISSAMMKFSLATDTSVTRSI